MATTGLSLHYQSRAFGMDTNGAFQAVYASGNGRVWKRKTAGKPTASSGGAPVMIPAMLSTTSNGFVLVNDVVGFINGLDLAQSNGSKMT